MEPQTRYVRTSDGIRIATHRLGEETGGVPVIIVPPYALGTFTSDWRVPDVREGYSRIAARRPVINYDPRGYGFSDREVTDLSLDARVADLAAVVDSVPGGRVCLLSRGPGSIHAIAYAAANPAHVTRVILASGIARSRDAHLNPDRRALMALIETNWELFLQASALADFGWDDGKVFAQDLREHVSREVVELAWRSARDFDVTPLLPQVTCPVLVVYAGNNFRARVGLGGRVGDIPLAAQRHLAASLPDARLATIQYAAPMIFVGQVESQLAVLEEFLAAGDGHTGARPAIPSGTTIIMFADIVDSTALTERLGDVALRERARTLDAALRGIITEHGGAAIEGKLLGDGVLATFPAASQGIAAAVAFGGAASAAQLRLHIGLHAGDVIREKDNVYGGAVNIAARICGLSEPGEILVSATVRELARTSTPVVFEDRGEHALKGIEDPVRVFAVRAAG